MMFSEVRLDYLCKYIISCITNFYSKSEGKELILCQDDHSGNEVIAKTTIVVFMASSDGIQKNCSSMPLGALLRVLSL